MILPIKCDKATSSGYIQQRLEFRLLANSDGTGHRPFAPALPPLADPHEANVGFHRFSSALPQRRKLFGRAGKRQELASRAHNRRLHLANRVREPGRAVAGLVVL